MATTVKIGPTFGFELQKAGLLGLPFSWSSDGTFIYAPSMTQTQKNQVNAVYTAHNANTSQLLAYSDNVRVVKQGSGITVSNVSTDVSPDAVSVLHQNVTYAIANPSATFNVIAPDFTVTQYSSAAIQTLYNSVQGYVKALYDMEGQVATGINNGTITTNAQIDNLYATIPTAR